MMNIMSVKYNPRKDPNPKITEEVVEKLLNDYNKQQLKNIVLLLFSRINNDNPDEYYPENDPYPRTTHHAVFGLWVDDNIEINEKIGLLLLKSVDEGVLPAPKYKDTGNVPTEQELVERSAEDNICNAVINLWNYVDTMPMRKNIALLLLKSVKEGKLIDGESLPKISSFPKPKNPNKPTAEEKRLRGEWDFGPNG